MLVQNKFNCCLFQNRPLSAKKFCVEITEQLSLESQPPLLLHLLKELDKLHVAKHKDQNCHERKFKISHISSPTFVRITKKCKMYHMAYDLYLSSEVSNVLMSFY